MMYKIPLLIYCVLCFTQKLISQQKPSGDSLVYELHLSSTATLSGGNLERIVFQNRLTGNLGNTKLQFVTENSYRYGRNFTRVVENDILTRNYIRVFPNNKLYGFLIATYENNFKRSINLRGQFGAGGALNLYQHKQEFLRISMALAYEMNRYKNDTFTIDLYNGKRSINELRAMFRVGGFHRILNNRLLLRHDTWFMVALKNPVNYRWHTLLGVQVPVYSGFSFKTDYEYTYESVTIGRPNPFGFPSRAFDWILSFGISYDLNRLK